MNTYKPDIKIYYGSISDNNRLIPAPDITISTEYNYSNDTIIGYSYIFNLTGSATALDLRNLDHGDEYPERTNYNLGAVVDHINKLRKILSNNGNILRIVNGQTDAIILEARGGILRSFSVDESNNNWTHFATYSASLEFTEVDFMSSTESCGGVFLDPTSFPDGQPGIVDINSFKIKNFSDSWNFTFGENESYDRIKTIDSGGNLNLNNITFNIEYSINATGKHHYISEGDNAKLLPAWEQAKNFVQHRLYQQVISLISNVLKNPYTSCTSSDGLNDIHLPGSDGLLSSLGDLSYKIYNEEITCEVSESEGSFSASYSAIVKSTLGNPNWGHPAAKHSVSKSIQNTRDANGRILKTISIEGNIEGLIEGGLIRTNKAITLPNSGAITLLNSSSDDKYNNAKIVLDKIYSSSDYNAGLGECGKRDLKPQYKSILGIDNEALSTSDGVKPDPVCPPEDGCIIPDPPHPASFNLTHDYNSGTISYSVEYNSDDASCQSGNNARFTQISIQTSKPNKVIATFNVPNSETCPIIQELGTYTAKTVTLNISGTDPSCKGKPNNIDFNTLISCGACEDDGDFPITIPLNGNFILTQKQYTKNPVDGSFSISLAYICDDGCILPKLN